MNFLYAIWKRITRTENTNTPPKHNRSPKYFDFTKQNSRWGHRISDAQPTNPEDNPLYCENITMIGHSSERIRVGDFIVIGDKKEAVHRYEVIAIKWYLDPMDMFKADTKHAYAKYKGHWKYCPDTDTFCGCDPEQAIQKQEEQ